MPLRAGGFELGEAERPSRQHVDGLGYRAAHGADLIETSKPRRIEHVRACRFESLQPFDGIVEVGAAMEEILRPRRQDEILAKRPGGFARRRDPLDRQAEFVDRLASDRR